MTQENISSVNLEGPLPVSNDIQKVTRFEGGGWKAVIECPESKDGNCNNDYQFMGPAAGINGQRRRETLRRMGIR